MAADGGEPPVSPEMTLSPGDLRPTKDSGSGDREEPEMPPKDERMEMARGGARASSTDGKGDATRSDSARIAVSVFGSGLTVAVALAALILTSAHYTREQFHDQNEQMRRHFAEQLEQMRRHSDSQFEGVRGDLREIREDLRELRGDLEEVRGDVRALAERQAKVEGLLLAVHRTGAGTPAPAGSANLSPSHLEDPPPE